MNNKTLKIINLLKIQPMTRTAIKRLYNSESALIRAENLGYITAYSDVNPDYQIGLRGVKPICKWYKIGKTEYIPRKSYPKAIARAITMLERAGYKVSGPTESNH